MVTRGLSGRDPEGRLVVAVDPSGDVIFWSVSVKVVLGIIGALGVVLALVLLLVPVSTHIIDAPCGSVLVPTKVHYSDGGELVFANTPSCREVRMARLPIGAVVGVAGLVFVAASLAMGRRRV